MCDPVGPQEIAERAGAAAGTVRSWMFRPHELPELNFPEADYLVSGRRIWEWSTVEAWLIRTGRVRAGATTIQSTVGQPCVEEGCDALALRARDGQVVWVATMATPQDHHHRVALEAVAGLFGGNDQVVVVGDGPDGHHDLRV